MAHQSWIFGIEEEDNSDNPQPEWKIGWKTSLAPHRIHQVASNSSGTVIAATTVNGTVSIMRGSDGKVLATRKVVLNTEDKVPSFPLEVAPEVSFVRTFLPSSSGTETIVRDGILVHAPDLGATISLGWLRPRKYRYYHWKAHVLSFILIVRHLLKRSYA